MCESDGVMLCAKQPYISQLLVVSCQALKLSREAEVATPQEGHLLAQSQVLTAQSVVTMGGV